MNGSWNGLGSKGPQKIFQFHHFPLSQVVPAWPGTLAGMAAQLLKALQSPPAVITTPAPLGSCSPKCGFSHSIGQTQEEIQGQI